MQTIIVLVKKIGKIFKMYLHLYIKNMKMNSNKNQMRNKKFLL